MITKEKLRVTKRIIEERGWGQGFSYERENTLCLGQALDHFISPEESQGFFANLIPIGIVSWNDTTGRTVEDIYALLDRAIEVAPE